MPWSYLSNYPCPGVVFLAAVGSVASPNDHFATRPDCCVSCDQRTHSLGWWLSKYPCWDCICRRCSNPDPGSCRPRRSFLRAGQTAVWRLRTEGAPVVLMAVQVLVLGLYLPPVFSNSCRCHRVHPQMIISLPVQTAVCSIRPEGARRSCWWPSNCFALGSYLPPVLTLRGC